MTRNPSMAGQYIAPRKHAGCKNEGSDGAIDGSGLQPKRDLYMARKVAAAQGGVGSQWY